MLKCLRRIMIRSRLKSLERGAPNPVRYIQMKKGDRIACLRVVPFPVNGKFDVFAVIKIGRNVKENQVNDGGCGAGRLRHDVKRFVSDVIIDSGFVSSNVPLLPKHGAIRDSVFAAKTVVCYVAFGTLRTVNQVTACRCSECVVLKLQPGDVGKIILPQSSGRVGNIKTQSNLDFMRRRRNFFARNFFARNFFARNFFARNFFARNFFARNFEFLRPEFLRPEFLRPELLRPELLRCRSFRQFQSHRTPRRYFSNRDKHSALRSKKTQKTTALNGSYV